MGLSRRKFLAGLAALTGISALAPAEEVLAQEDRRRKTIVLTDTATTRGQYLYLPFKVPRGVNRIDAKLTKEGDASVGVGLFDQRGIEYESPGFRGVFGAESNEFFVSARHATRSFTPGRIKPGKWTVIVPVFDTTGPTEIKVRVTLSFGSQGETKLPGPEVGVVSPNPGWYKGELHCHTPQSSDAWASGSSLTPEGWADKAREIGLDFISLTDHNVTKQNWKLREDAGEGVLLIAGEEMTNWFHGHATVTGIEPGDHLDWRQRPEFGEFAVAELGPGEARIEEFIAEARRLGAYVSAAHPAAPLPGLTWQFFADAEENPEGALTDGLEVWTGPHQPDDEATLLKWDDFLRRGWKVWANGGSDTHGIKNSPFQPGYPTNVVYADSLSKEGIVSALKRGRMFLTRLPDGAEVYLSATGPDAQAQIVGGTIYGEADDLAEFTVLVRKGSGMRLVLLRDGAPVQTTLIESNEQEVKLTQPIAPRGYVRAELRGQADIENPDPLAKRTDMEALTNPIFLEIGP